MGSIIFWCPIVTTSTSVPTCFTIFIFISAATSAIILIIAIAVSAILPIIPWSSLIPSIRVVPISLIRVSIVTITTSVIKPLWLAFLIIRAISPR
uniref:Uncharacterized protein n=1 Tax=Nyssomyia neivai TaxID=330878 RepID=A0A1L8D705_9DIPT